MPAATAPGHPTLHGTLPARAVCLDGRWVLLLDTSVPLRTTVRLPGPRDPAGGTVGGCS